MICKAKLHKRRISWLIRTIVKLRFDSYGVSSLGWLLEGAPSLPCQGSILVRPIPPNNPLMRTRKERVDRDAVLLADIEQDRRFINAPHSYSRWA